MLWTLVDLLHLLVVPASNMDPVLESNLRALSKTENAEARASAALYSEWRSPSSPDTLRIVTHI